MELRGITCSFPGNGIRFITSACARTTSQRWFCLRTSFSSRHRKTKLVIFVFVYLTSESRTEESYMGLLRPSDEFAAKVDSSGGIATSKNE